MTESAPSFACAGSYSDIMVGRKLLQYERTLSDFPVRRVILPAFIIGPCVVPSLRGGEHGGFRRHHDQLVMQVIHGVNRSAANKNFVM